jgi:hypothetical protein
VSKPKFKTRITAKMFVEGTKVKSFYVVEICMNRKWTMLGGADGVTKHATKESAQKAIDDLANIEFE